MRLIRNAIKSYIRVVNKIARYRKENADTEYKDWANNKYVNPIFDLLVIPFKILMYLAVLALVVGFLAFIWEIAKYIFNLIF